MTPRLRMLMIAERRDALQAAVAVLAAGRRRACWRSLRSVDFSGSDYCPTNGGSSPEVYRGSHRVLMVTAFSSSGRGMTPIPGPVGTGRWPSLRTNGVVMSVR